MVSLAICLFGNPENFMIWKFTANPIYYYIYNSNNCKPTTIKTNHHAIHPPCAQHFL